MAAILITGGTGRFGQMFVRHFLRLGWDVFFTSTKDENIRSLQDDLRRDVRSKLVGLNINLEDPAAPSSLASQICNDYDGIDCLVNNARSLDNLATRPDGTTDREHFLREFLIDVVAPYELSIAFASTAQDRLRSIVNIGSQYGVVAPNPALYEEPERGAPIQYGVAKAALGHLTKELAVRLAPKKIRVNCIAFGGVAGRVDKEFERRYASMTPMGGMLTPEQLPGPLEYLATDMSAGMTGETILVDGGWTIW